MELGELCKKTLDIFECDNISKLGGKLYDAVINNDIVKLTAFCNTVKDLTVDWLQKIFQCKGIGKYEFFIKEWLD